MGGVLVVYMFYGLKGVFVDRIPQAVILLVIPLILMILLAFTTPPGYFDN